MGLLILYYNIWGKGLSSIYLHGRTETVTRNILVHRFVNNYTNRVGYGFECAGIKAQA